jgi:hypothetical protein
MKRQKKCLGIGKEIINKVSRYLEENTKSEGSEGKITKIKN